jgi:hypothetical protein
VILAICADKGAPGATTLATALGVVWPVERVLLDADPSGGDLAFRLLDPQGDELASEPTVMSLAADARESLPPGSLTGYTQQTSLGVPVLLGPLSAEGFEPMARLWPQVAAEAQRWPGTVIADLGRLQLRHAAGPVAAAGTAVLLVMRADSREDLYHGRDRTGELAGRLGQGPHGRSPLAVTVVCPSRDGRWAVGEVQRVLASQAATSTIPVLGFLAEDARGVAGLRAGKLSRRLLGSDLIRSARTLAETLLDWWPEFTPASGAQPHSREPTPSAAAAQSPARHTRSDLPSAGGGER